VPESLAEVRDGQMRKRSLPQPSGASEVDGVIDLAQHRTVGAKHHRDSDLIGREVPQRKGSAYCLLECLGIVTRCLGEPTASELPAEDDTPRERRRASPDECPTRMQINPPTW
jgi:hypothetical protein